MARESGQATIEVLAAVPLLILAGAVALQLLLCGYALTLADGAAEAGALALAAGRPAKRAAENSLPAWAAERSEVAIRGGEVTVRLLPPSLLGAAAKHLAVRSRSYARPK
jgi:hypothetical protein